MWYFKCLYEAEGLANFNALESLVIRELGNCKVRTDRSLPTDIPPTSLALKVFLHRQSLLKSTSHLSI